MDLEKNKTKLYNYILDKKYSSTLKLRMREFHKIAMAGLDVSDSHQYKFEIEKGFTDCKHLKPGDFRTEHLIPTTISNQIMEFITPCSVDVEELLDLLIRSINYLSSKAESEEDLWIIAAYAQFHISVIHPFPVGNGTVARAFAASLLYEKTNHLFADKFTIEQKNDLQKTAFCEIEMLLRQTDIYDWDKFDEQFMCFNFEKDNFKDLSYLNSYFTKLRDLLIKTYFNTKIEDLRINSNFIDIAKILKSLPAR